MKQMNKLETKALEAVEKSLKEIDTYMAMRGFNEEFAKLIESLPALLEQNDGSIEKRAAFPDRLKQHIEAYGSRFSTVINLNQTHHVSDHVREAQGWLEAIKKD